VIGFRSTRTLALAILAIVPTLLFIDVLTGYNCLYSGDVSRYHYPLKHVLREIVLSGEFPYWNPYLSGGQPLAANPAHEVFYPLTWLILLPSYRAGFHLLALAHLYIATFGMYALLRSMSTGRAAAVLGALSFGAGGLLVSSLNAFPFLFSAAWIPWIVLFARRCLLLRSRHDFVLATLLLGLQFLVGEPMTSLQTGIILLMLALTCHPERSEGPGRLGGTRSAPPTRPGPSLDARDDKWRSILIVALISIAALAVAAVQILPGVDHFRDTQREEGIAYGSVAKWSTPPVRIAELFYPDLLGDTRRHDRQSYWGVAHYGERQLPFFHGIYPGLLIAVLAATGLVARVSGRGLFAAIGIPSLLLALGHHTPILRVLYELGIAGMFRYPEKFLIMGIFATVVFGALVLDRLLAGDAQVRRVALLVTAAVAAIALAIAILASTPLYESFFRGVWRPPLRFDVRLMLAASQKGWWLAVARGAVLLSLIAAFGRLPRKGALVLLGAFVVVDLGSLIGRLAPRYPSAFYDQEPAVVRQFPRDRKPFRIFFAGDLVAEENSHRYPEPHPDAQWMWRNGLPPLMPLIYDLRLAAASDWDVTALKPANEFAAAATELIVEKPRNWLGAIASTSNVWYVSVNRRLDQALLEAKGIRRNVQPVRWMEVQHFPRYYFASELISIRDRRDFVRLLSERVYGPATAFIYEPARNPARGIVRSVREWNNGARLEVESMGDAFLVMSVTPHRYWTLTIDGVEAPAVGTNVGYQGIFVPRGAHIVEMRYHNPLIAAGGAVSIAALLALVLVWRKGAGDSSS